MVASDHVHVYDSPFVIVYELKFNALIVAVSQGSVMTTLNETVVVKV